jgi:streptogramin lyase
VSTPGIESSACLDALGGLTVRVRDVVGELELKARHRLLGLTVIVSALLAALTLGFFVADAAANPPGAITRFKSGFRPIPVPGCGPSECNSPRAITTGPDGNLWFTDDGYTPAYGAYTSIGRITPQGNITEFSDGLTAHSFPVAITAGPDGNLWFTEPCAGPCDQSTSAIGRITPTGVITEFREGLNPVYPGDITAGPDSNLWFTDLTAIGRITPSGEITEFTAGLGPNAVVEGIAPGPDGNLWFTELDSTPTGDFVGAAIGRITPSGTITEFPYGDQSSHPDSIVQGPDGNLWFTDSRYPPSVRIGRITPSGAITEFSLDQSVDGLADISVGPDGNLWFTLSGNSRGLGRVTPQGTATLFDSVEPEATTTGPDGNLWFTESDDSDLGPAIGRIVLGDVAGSPPPGARVNTKLLHAKINDAKRRATFKFSGQGGVGKLTLQCKLTGQSKRLNTWRTCNSPKTYQKLKNGKHVFLVRARDASGNVDRTPAKTRFKISQ